MATITQILPNADVSNVQTNLTGSSRWAALANATSSDWVQFITGASDPEVIVDMAAYTLLANERCAGIRVVAKYDTGAGSIQFHGYIRDTTDLQSFYTTSRKDTLGTLTGAWVTLDHSSAEWNNTSIGTVRMRLLDDNGGGSLPRVTYAYLDLDVRQQLVATINSPGSGSDLSFRATWAKSGGSEAQTKYRVKVFTKAVAEGGGFDPESASTIYDSGIQSGSFLQHDVPTGYLSYGTDYYIYVKIASDFNGADWYSPWNGIAFKTNSRPVVTVSAPTGTVTTTNKPPVTWSVADADAGDVQNKYRIKIFSAAQYGAVGFDPETSTATWDSGTITDTVVTATPTVPLSSPVTYRAYVKVTQNNYGIESAWAFSAFSTNITGPVAPLLTVTPNANGGNNALSAFIGNGTLKTTDWLIFQRSTDFTTPGIEVNLIDVLDVGKWTSGNNKLTVNQSSLESGTTGWASLLIATIAQSATQADEGTNSLRLTAASAATMSATTPLGTSGFTVTAGRRYRISGKGRAGTTGRSCKFGIAWYDSAGVLLSTTYGTSFNDVNSAFTQQTDTITAPASAAYGAFQIVVTSPASSEIHYFDTMVVAEEVIIYDNTALSGVSYQYRVVAVNSTGGSELSTNSNVVTQSITFNKVFLTNPSVDTSTIYSFPSVEGWINFTQARKKSVNEIVGKQLPIVIGSVYNPEVFSVSFLVIGQSGADNMFPILQTLLDSGDTLLLKWRRRGIWCHVADSYESNEHLFDEVGAEDTARIVTVPFIEVDPVL